MSAKIPPFLKLGDKVGICCTARFVTPELIRPCIETLQAWGVVPVLGENIYQQQYQFAGNDFERAIDLQSFLDNPEIKAIVMGKGGYGSVRIIDSLDFTAFNSSPKWLCGFSDITVVHSHIHAQFGIATLHSPMAVSFQPGNALPEALASFKDFLFGKWPDFTFENTFSTPNRLGYGQGQIVGGNLSLLYALSGSASDMDLKGKILFLEDIDEYVYHIDRMMWQVKRSGKLSHLAGLVIGGFTDMKDNASPFGMDAQTIISEAVKEYAYPVAFGLPVGHIPNNYPLPLGVEAKLTVGEKSSNLVYMD